MADPLLTLYIPTYNRAELLRSAIMTAASQAKALGGRVEVLVSDNASPDHTGEVVTWARQFGPIRYHRNKANIGGGNNFLQGPVLLARGEFCWVMGDDDLLIDNALETMVAAIEVNPDLDYIFANYAIQKERPEGIVRAREYMDRSSLRCRMLETRRVERWEDIISFTDSADLFTFLGNHVMRVSAWRTYAPQPQPPQTEMAQEFSSMESTYPHAIAVAKYMMGKPALYVGEPVMLLFGGAEDKPQSLSAWAPFLHLVRQQELAEFFKTLGMRPEMFRRYISLQFQNSSYLLWNLLLNPKTLGRDQVPHFQNFRRYAGYPAFWKMWTLYPVNVYVKPLFRPVKCLVGAMKASQRAKTS